MKVLITSAGGLAEGLFAALRQQHQVRVLRRRPDERFGPSCVVGDVACLDDVLRAMDGCDVVFHTAVRNNNTDMALAHYPQFLQSNVDGTFNVMLAAARLRTPRVVYSSTSMVLGFQRWLSSTPPGQRAVRIHDHLPHDPTCIYSMTKSLAEKTADFFRDEHGVNVVGLRYGWLAPLANYGKAAMLLNTLVFCLHPDDGVAANLAAAQSNKTGNYLIACAPAFNEGDREALWRDPRAVLTRRFPRELAYLDRIGCPIKPIGCWLDGAPAMRELGYQPRYDFRWFVAQHEAGAFPQSANLKADALDL